ncbi:TadE/TadG family type IV pilus assembly protein [Janibacter sp. LM]|uniref:TadE/TadG family type IV pilus assembly protein n=1 Tax=Janibacter sp. LM TaxID=3144845 RepID=UPI0031F69011
MSLRAHASRRLQGERGGVAVIVAVLFSGMVIIGMLAVSVDLGNLTYERRQLQNGADATSLALAQECAEGAAGCTPAGVSDLLNPNAGDERMQYDNRTANGAPSGVCGRGAGSLPTCLSTGSIGDLGECPPLPTWLAGTGASVPYVETYTRTLTTSGDDELFLPFSRVLAGGSDGDAGTTACARSAWGSPMGHRATLPLTFNDCEWREQTNDGTDYVEDGPVGTKPGYGNIGAGQPQWPDAAREIVLILHNPKTHEAKCSWNGKDFPGGFGWLGTTACTAEVTDGNWVQVDPGKSAGSCKSTIAPLHETVVEIPIFDCVGGFSTAPTASTPLPSNCDPTDATTGGKKSWYHIAGWGRFYISGINVPGVTENSHVRGGPPCTGSVACISGWFLTGTLADAPGIAPPGSGNNFGVNVIKPAG